MVNTPRLVTGDGAAAAAFEAAMRDAVLGRGTLRSCPATVAAPEARIVYQVDYDVTLRTQRVIAVAFSVMLDGGGARPLSYTHAVAFDLARRRTLAIADLVEPTHGLQAVVSECSNQFRQEREEASGRAIDPELLAGFAREARELVGDARHWELEPDRVTIVLDRLPYGPFNCDIPMATLRPLLPADSPLR
jgi:hypothetical protein